MLRHSSLIFDLKLALRTQSSHSHGTQLYNESQLRFYASVTLRVAANQRDALLDEYFRDEVF